MKTDSLGSRGYRWSIIDRYYDSYATVTMENASVLLIEDNPDDEALTLLVFKKHHIEDIAMIGDRAEALYCLFSNGEYQAIDMPSLLLSDLKLPHLDGLELLKNICADARTKLLAMVVLASSSEAQDLEQSYGLGANSDVRKPVDYLESVGVTKQQGTNW